MSPPALADYDCPPAFVRWQDDCRPKAGEAAPQGLERAKFLPLTKSGSVFVSFGGEARLRYEYLDRPTYGITNAPRWNAFDQRYYLHTDLHAANGWRAFAQLSLAHSSGRAPQRSVDESDVDLQQAFVDAPVGSRAVLRLGRQEFDGDGARLFSYRDGANLRRSFDMALLDWRPGKNRVAAFVGAPVVNRPGAFDDRRTPGERLYGIIARRRWETEGVTHTLQFYGLQRRRESVAYLDAPGAAERRRTYAVRIAADGPRYAYVLTGGAQRGRAGASRIRAFGVSGEAFGKTHVGAWPMRAGLTFGYASGDERAGDGSLGTFDPLYPNLSYYTDAPIVYPGNSADVGPHVYVKPRRDLEIELGADRLWRTTEGDAIYQNGFVRVRPEQMRGRALGALATAKAVWTPTPHLAVTGAYVHGDPGEALDAAGARPFNYAYFQLAAKI